MMKRFGMGAAIFLAAMIWGAAAQAEEGVSVIGVGRGSCGQFIATIGNVPPGQYREMNNAKGVFVSENWAYEEWLMGFVSGFNAAHAADLEQQVTKIDHAGVDLWMRNWCNKHPTQTVVEGAIAFIIELRNNAVAGQR